MDNGKLLVDARSPDKLLLGLVFDFQSAQTRFIDSQTRTVFR